MPKYEPTNILIVDNHVEEEEAEEEPPNPLVRMNMEEDEIKMPIEKGVHKDDVLIEYDGIMPNYRSNKAAKYASGKKEEEKRSSLRY